MTETTADPFRTEIVAKAGTYYRNARYLIVTMCLVAGLWFAYDGWIAWPAERNKFDALSPEKRALVHAPHQDLDIRLQKLLASCLVPLAPAMLIYFLYRSRGTYRLSREDTLYVPGHPPVEIENIVAIDKSLWKRKGIAYIEYTVNGSTNGRLKLDDFVYQQEPTDEIMKRLETHFEPDESPAQAQTAEKLEVADEANQSPEINQDPSSNTL